jgi:repressor LexA
MSKLKDVRKAAGYTQAEVAEYIGLSQPQYSAWENGRSKIDHVSLARLADLFNCTVDALIDRPQRSTSLRIPVLGDVAAGIPIEAITDIEDYEEIDEAMAASGEYFGLRIKGASMEPRMREGDVVIVRKQDTAKTGDTVVALVNGDSATVKKIKYGSDGISLIPTNPAYDVQFYSAADVERLPVRVIGRVVELRAKY